MKQLYLKYLLLRNLTEYGVIAPGRIRTYINPADIGTKLLGSDELEPKKENKLALGGIQDLDYEDVERKITDPNDASV